MDYPHSHMLIMERINYTRTYLNRGLVAALAAGNQQAGQVLRAQQHWFYTYPHKYKVMELHLPWQGMLADTDAGMSAVGEDEDALCAEAAYVKKDWLEKILQRDTRAIWQYPNDGTHSNELIAFFAYAQLYLLTGNPLYYQTVLSVWDMIRKYWIHEGGTIALCEHHDNVCVYHPGSRPIGPDQYTGEVCASVIWINLNDVLLQLEPEKEAYAAEIERTLYNALLPAQSGSDGIRYHTYLHGKVDRPNNCNTCCEGTATQLYGLLPAFVYRLHADDDGATVHLFAASTLENTTANGSYRIELDTRFPEDDAVTLTVTAARPMGFPLKIRVPSWMEGKLDIFCGDEIISSGQPRTYITIDRLWEGEIKLHFCLKRSLKVHRYEGVSVVRGYERYALTCGPILMAVTGANTDLSEELIGWRGSEETDRRSFWNNRHWIMDADHEKPESFLADPNLTVKPYYQVGADEEFTCYPLVRQRAADYTISPERSFATGLLCRYRNRAHRHPCRHIRDGSKRL